MSRWAKWGVTIGTMSIASLAWSRQLWETLTAFIILMLATWLEEVKK